MPVLRVPVRGWGGLVSTRMVVLVLGARLRSSPLWQGVLGKAAHCTNIGFLAS